MNNKVKFFFLIAVAGVILYSIGLVVYGLIRTSPCSYSIIFDSGNRCRHLFQDSISNDLNCFYSSGNANGANYAYKYKNRYRFMVWELGDFRNVELNNVKYYKTSNPLKINSSVIGRNEIGGNPDIQIKDIICFQADKKISLLLGDGSNIKTEIDSVNCKIYLCELNEFSIENDAGEVQMIISYETIPAYTVLIMLKKNDTFFLISINSYENKEIPIKALQYLKLN